jgi:endonuclease YncB( thermonuclease family)
MHHQLHRSTCLTLVLLTLTLALAACAVQTAGTAAPTANEAQPATNRLRPIGSGQDIPRGERATVDWVYDGDTVAVSIDGEEYDVRYIGVDTPEREEPFYEEAKDYNIDLTKGEEVILVKDVSDTDQYGRLLRYVYLEDGTFVNAEIIRDGWARLITFPPDVSNADYFRELQEEAREEGVGMWANPELTGPCDCDRNLYNCDYFQTQDEAQTCFEYCYDTQGRDVHNLDGGGDGVVCEFLP